MYDAKRDRTIVPLRHIEAKSVKDTGLFEVYNSTTLELVKTVTSGGLHPHEPKLIPGTDEIACTHYGEIYAENPPFIMNVVEPKLTILDAETLEVKRHYVQQDYAMLTHMDIDDKGQAYCVMTQALRINKNHPDGWEAAVNVADKQMQQLLNFKRDFPLPYRIADRSRIDIPLPMIQIDTQTGERKDYFTGFANQMRGQSVAKNSVAGIAAGVFYHSDTLITHRSEANQLLATKAADLGLADMRGICELEGTPYIALAGSNRGVIIIDARNFEVIRRYSIDTHENVHLSARMVG